MADQPFPKHRRLLFVAHQACGTPGLCALVRAHAADGAEVLVVAPDDAEGRALADERLEESVHCLREHGLHAHGTLGDPDPVQAVDDALYWFGAQEIIICLEEPERVHWHHEGILERAKTSFKIPVTEVTVPSRQLAA